MGITVDLTSVPELAEASEQLCQRAYHRGQVDLAMRQLRRRGSADLITEDMEARLADMDAAGIDDILSVIMETVSPDRVADLLRSGIENRIP